VGFLNHVGSGGFGGDVVEGIPGRGSSGKFVDDSCGGGGGSYNVGKDQQRDCLFHQSHVT